MSAIKDYDITYKILVLGDSGVGKTCLIRRFTDDDFTDSFLSTIGKNLYQIIKKIPRLLHAILRRDQHNFEYVFLLNFILPDKARYF